MNNIDTARSYVKRHRYGIMAAYRNIILSCPSEINPLFVALDYVSTVNSNIELFLRDKTNCMRISLENAKEDFPLLWHMISAEGDSAKCFV